mmetsp:Transcript_19205/g.54749  ORF Transcript_19205/g.54749 Transcript_19205/m.54749 type:complete len:232 (-) Transcript_19205:1566-2261(-)
MSSASWTAAPWRWSAPSASTRARWRQPGASAEGRRRRGRAWAVAPAAACAAPAAAAWRPARPWAATRPAARARTRTRSPRRCGPGRCRCAPGPWAAGPRCGAPPESRRPAWAPAGRSARRAASRTRAAPRRRPWPCQPTATAPGGRSRTRRRPGLPARGAAASSCRGRSANWRMASASAPARARRPASAWSRARCRSSSRGSWRDSPAVRPGGRRGTTPRGPRCRSGTHKG